MSGSTTDVRATSRLSISKECTDPRSIEDARQRAAAKLGFSSFKEMNKRYFYIGSRMRMSYDMEGRTFWTKPNASLSGNKSGADQFAPAPECAPNSPEFYYRNFGKLGKRYHMLWYYEQRQIDQFTGANYPYYFLQDGKDIEIGPVSLELRNPVITVSQFSPVPARVPVDISWYMANDGHYNPYSLTGYYTTNPKKDGTTGVGSGWANLDPRDPGSLAPINLRATVYMVPRDFDVQRSCRLSFGRQAKFRSSVRCHLNARIPRTPSSQVT